MSPRRSSSGAEKGRLSFTALHDDLHEVLQYQSRLQVLPIVAHCQASPLSTLTLRLSHSVLLCITARPEGRGGIEYRVIEELPCFLGDLLLLCSVQSIAGEAHLFVFIAFHPTITLIIMLHVLSSSIVSCPSVPHCNCPRRRHTRNLVCRWRRITPIPTLLLLPLQLKTSPTELFSLSPHFFIQQHQTRLLTKPISLNISRTRIPSQYPTPGHVDIDTVLLEDEIRIYCRTARAFSAGKQMRRRLNQIGLLANSLFPCVWCLYGAVAGDFLQVSILVLNLT